ncbi:TlpA family protein disulfide reductase [Sulfurospirillum barnesii]|uniref:Thiol-disulfide isomerase-like thioredoxin n=1 Tax=Sulfurospirillum barnesii (strain ATCC 700032 / DSM 10660 / SES-3) TaxID=760154 RepID=I3XWB5_SULBS|nr:TlpA disulfide reductase family protein [Sulfurospirillum barnesii]AFL68239.1 thiol-disulfide isomerase-like thioredoxin [Sulfurospirillum barnesii SES-3]
MKFWLTLFVSCSILFFQGCSSDKKRKDEDKNMSSPQTLKREKITLQDVYGKSIQANPTEKGFTFSGFENKVVLVNFFTTWCPPCKAEIPHLINLQEKYKEHFVIISVLLEENKSNEEIQSFIKFNAINYIITNGPENFEFAKNVGGVKNIPFMFLYDRNGNYSTHYVGAIPEEMIDADIKKVL